MTTELTAKEAWNLLPHGLNTRVPYSDLPESDKDRFSLWYAYIKERIAAEKDAEIERLKARIAELEHAATPRHPKPRMTAGEKLAADLSDAWGTYEFPGNPAAIQSLAMKRGYTDDIEPPSDGELLCEAYNAKVMLPLMEADFWMHTAVEFLAKRAERDGVQHENA